jgi:hypothetical protein
LEKIIFGTLLQRNSKVGTSEKVMSHHCVTDHRGSFSQSIIKAQYKNENNY